jgi:hypothetical protein
MGEPYVPMTGAQRIAAERERQIFEEGYEPAHDKNHEDDALARAGAVYATPDDYRAQVKDLLWPISWPYKPTPDDPIRELEKAGALIAAEIDRLIAASDKGAARRREFERRYFRRLPGTETEETVPE